MNSGVRVWRGWDKSTRLSFLNAVCIVRTGKKRGEVSFFWSYFCLEFSTNMDAM